MNTGDRRTGWGLRWRVRGHSVGEGGVTLLEVMVAMSLMSTVMALVGSGLVMAYQVGNRAAALTDVQQALHTTFSRLDAQLRYSSGISSPGTVGSDQYVEFASFDAGVTVCRQLRSSASTGTLQTRMLQGGDSVGPWSVLASHVVSPVSFIRTLAVEDGPGHQQLTVTLTAQAGNGSTRQRQSASMTFTALNTNVETESDNVCSMIGRP